MNHFEDPAISGMQSALAESLEQDGHDADSIAAHPQMQKLEEVAHHLNEQREAIAHKVKKRNLKRIARVHKAGTCAEMYVKLALAHLYHDKARVKKLQAQLDYSSCDAKWVDAINRYIKNYHPGFGRHRIPYVRYQDLSDFVFDGFDDDLKVGILGDWGTGTSLAMKQLNNMLKREPDLIIHLGDVYYSGGEAEYERKLLKPFRELAVKPDGSRIPVFNLAGNHDMYSGGKPYYESTPRLNDDPALKQEASYFCLRLKGKKWQILCGDTALNDHDPFMVSSRVTHLDPEEVKWHQDKVRQFSEQSGRTIFVTHHQPFSPHDQLGSLAIKKPSDFYVNPNLVQQFDEISSAGDVPLWLWGHEHNLAIYAPYAGIDKGRCLGHSAVPVLSGENDPYAVNKLGEGSWWLALLGFLKGKWGFSVAKEWKALGQLHKDADDFPRPELDKSGGEEVRLDVVDFERGPNADPLDIYEQGFVFMTFGTGNDHQGVTVDYHGEDWRNPLFSETL